MISLSYVLIIMLGHYIGDFVLQSDKEATEKSRDAGVLFLHVFKHTVAIFLAMALYMFLSGQYTNVDSHITSWISVNLGAHFIIDFITSRFNRYYNNIKNTKSFWNTIGFDQWLHLVTILGSSYIFLFN